MPTFGAAARGTPDDAWGRGPALGVAKRPSTPSPIGSGWVLATGGYYG